MADDYLRRMILTIETPRIAIIPPAAPTTEGASPSQRKPIKVAVDEPTASEIRKSGAQSVFVKADVKGDLVILDNLAVHKSAKADASLKERGVWFFFLPPYSPDLNPIEMPSQSSRRICEKPVLEPSMISGAPSVISARSSLQTNVGPS